MGVYIIATESGGEVGVKDSIHPPAPWLWVENHDDSVTGIGLNADEARRIAHALLEAIGEAPAQ